MLKRLTPPQLALSALLVISVLAAVACAGRATAPAQPPGAATAPAEAAPVAAAAPPTVAPPPSPVAIKIGHPNNSMSMLPIRVAQEQGFFAEEGLVPELILMASSATIAAVVTGELQYSAAGSSVMQAAARGLPIRLVVAVRNRASHVMLVRPEINSLADLRGKIVAVGSLRSYSHQVLRELLAQAGIPEDSVETLALGDGRIRFEAMKLGQAHATAADVDELVLAKDAGMKELVFAGDAVELPSTAFGASVDHIQREPAQVERFVRTIVKALQFIHQDRAGTVPLIAKYWELDPADAEEAYDLGVRSLSRDGSTSDRSIQLTVRLAASDGGVDPNTPVSQIADFSILNRVQRQLGIQ